MKNWKVFGPFDLPRDDKLVSDDAGKKRKFWNEVNKRSPKLSNACGCYVFLVGKFAWYVGKTEKNCFSNECFQTHKLHQYAKALQKKQGTPKLILVSKLTKGNKFTKPSKNGHKDIEALEKLLIGAALKKNQKLLNIKDTKILREMHVPGFINTTQGEGKADTVRAFRKAIGVNKKG